VGDQGTHARRLATQRMAQLMSDGEADNVIALPLPSGILERPAAVTKEKQIEVLATNLRKVERASRAKRICSAIAANED
jgi:hypothetical protein